MDSCPSMSIQEFALFVVRDRTTMNKTSSQKNNKKAPWKTTPQRGGELRNTCDVFLGVSPPHSHPQNLPTPTSELYRLMCRGDDWSEYHYLQVWMGSQLAVLKSICTDHDLSVGPPAAQHGTYQTRGHVCLGQLGKQKQSTTHALTLPHRRLPVPSPTHASCVGSAGAR